MSEGGNPVPPPYVLDLSILTAVARGDTGVTGLLLIFDGRGQPLVLPVLAVLQASLDTRTADADRALRGVVAWNMPSSLRCETPFRPQGLPGDLQDRPGSGGRACGVRRRCFDLPHPHHGRGKWREHAGKLDKPLNFVEYAEPDEPPEDSESGS